MKSNIIIVVIILALVFSCKKKEEAKVNYTDENSGTVFREKLSNEKLIDSLEKLVLYSGDTLAYNQLKGIHYMGEQKLAGLLYYSLVMSNKYHYKKASYDVYDILTYDEKAVDEKTKKIANEYLDMSK